MENKIPTAEEFLKKKQHNGIIQTHSDYWEAMIEFAKLHVEKILELQHLKYYAGETGYIKKEEWEELLTNIK